MSGRLFAFVLMPFDEAFDDIYELGVKAAAESLGITAQRVDEQVFHQETMLARIYDQIEAADIVIADMSGRNPNVFYEVGYAHAKEKTCILLTSRAEDIPFDLKHHRHIIYGSSIAELKRKLLKDLEYVKRRALEAAQAIAISVGTPSCTLMRLSHSAEAHLTLTFDLYNKTDHASPEIDAIYLYTEPGWIYSMDKQECLSTNSDVDAFGTRHLIRAPIRRLQKRNGWAQIKIEGSKTLKYATTGEPIQEQYAVQGRSMLRVITPIKTIDYNVEVNADCKEGPF